MILSPFGFIQTHKKKLQFTVVKKELFDSIFLFFFIKHELLLLLFIPYNLQSMYFINSLNTANIFRTFITFIFTLLQRWKTNNEKRRRGNSAILIVVYILLLLVYWVHIRPKLLANNLRAVY